MDLLASIGTLLDQFQALEIISLGDMIREFGINLYRQLDLRVEAKNINTFNSNFVEDSTWAEFPHILEALVSKHVIVETLMEGNYIIIIPHSFPTSN